MHQKFSYFLGILVFSVLFTSCVQEPEYSNIPEIGFESITKINKVSDNGFGEKTKIDSLIMRINFKDGDGDLGITDAEIKSNPKYKDFKNFIVETYLQRNGKFELLNLNPALGGLVNFKFKPNQKAGPIEGTIDYSSQFVYAFYKGYSPLFTPKNDTLKFKIQIVDNAFHQSNVVETTPVVIFQN
ncbi:MAG: hypothetical protein RI995_1125 [Bacteroidota bacterium]|jgi:hypothetical protein